MSSTRVVRRIRAARHRVYGALLNPREVAQWMVPDGMTAHVHSFDGREIGAFRISLRYDEHTGRGKTTAQTDSYHGRFIRLDADRQVVQQLEFETSDPAMRGEMTVTFSLSDCEEGTEVEGVHDGLPPGIRPEDNVLGWTMALAKLARLVEQ